jgi:hypothetical protein
MNFLVGCVELIEEPFNLGVRGLEKVRNTNRMCGRSYSEFSPSKTRNIFSNHAQ